VIKVLARACAALFLLVLLMFLVMGILEFFSPKGEIILDVGATAQGEVLKNYIDAIDPYVMLRWADRLWDDNGTFQKGSYYLNYANLLNSPYIPTEQDIDQNAQEKDSNVWTEGYAFDQNVDSAASPEFVNLTISGNLTDGTNSLTVANAKTAFDHVTADGSSHTFIDQNLTKKASPTFGGLPQIGDDTNYTSIAPNGEILLHGTARYYDGHEINPTDFKEPPSGNPTLVNRGMGVAYDFGDGSDEHIHTEFRIPSKWATSEDITLVLIWSSPTASEDCNWGVKYLFRTLNEDMSVTTPDDIITSLLTSSGIANGLVHSTIAIPAIAFDTGDKKLLLQLWRYGSDNGDTLEASAYLHGVLIRGTAYKLGGAT